MYDEVGPAGAFKRSPGNGRRAAAGDEQATGIQRQRAGQRRGGSSREAQGIDIRAVTHAGDRARIQSHVTGRAPGGRVGAGLIAGRRQRGNRCAHRPIGSCVGGPAAQDAVHIGRGGRNGFAATARR